MRRRGPVGVCPLLVTSIFALTGFACALTTSEALLAQKDAIVNWPQFYAGNNMTGWTDPASDPCTWSGVLCENGVVTQLNLACWRDVGFCSVAAMGAIARQLAQISTLEIVDVRRQMLSGYLPRDWGVDAVPFRQLLLGHNQIMDTLPESWGLGIFPNLQVMGLASNNWTGTLPSQWAGANAFPKLLQLTITNHEELPYERRISGTIPASWTAPGAFPSLAGIDLSYGALTGTLPASWGSTSLPNMLIVSVRNNRLSGPLPEGWGTPGVFKNLKALALQNNSLSGTLPDSWAQAGAFPKLQNLTLDNNTLTGDIPASWGDKAAGAFPSLQLLSVDDNAQLCGAVPVSLQSAVCGVNSSCVTANGVSEIPCQTVPPTPVPAGTPPVSPPAAAQTPPPGVSPTPSPTVPAPLPAPAIPPPTLSTPPTSPPPLVSSPPPLPAAASPPLVSPPAQSPPQQPSPSTPQPLLAPPPPPDDGTVTAASTPPPTSSSSSAPIGAIVGGVIGGLAALAVLAFFALRPNKGWLRRTAGGPPPPTQKLPPAVDEKGITDTSAGGGPPSKGDDAGMDSFLLGGGAAVAPTPGGHPTGSGPGPSSQSSGPHTSSLLDSFLAGSTAAEAGAGQAAALAAGGAAAGSLTSARAVSSEDDALLSYIDSRLSSLQRQQLASLATSGAGGMAVSSVALSSGVSSRPGTERSQSSSGASLHASMAQWEVFWKDIEIIRPVGGGSFGRVYQAQWRETPVACKILLTKEFSDASEPGVLELPANTMRQLQEEAAVMGRMRHPNLVNFMGLCMVPPCILTEFCAKGSLYSVLQRARQSSEAASQLGWQRRLGMALDAAVGLLYLHSLQPAIIHRDVKSPNLLVDKAWNVKVADFNLSKIMSNTGSLMSTGTSAANPLWLAPEILAGGSATAASDVFAFGVVLYELLTWRLPWEGVSTFKIALLVLQGDRPEAPPREALPGPDNASFADLDAYMQLMKDCWAQEPYERPTFKEVVPRLRALLGTGDAVDS